ncbi:PH domain protein, partial [Teladorsagia circumcincta]
VVTWISRVIDRICSAAGLDPRLTEKLTQVIPGFVAVHIDNLEQVYAESRKLAPPPKLASGLHDGLQMRSSCFQLLKVAFDEEVRGDEVEAFTKALSSLRWPNVLPHSLFAYNTVSHLLTSTLPAGSKNKYSTIRELKKTIARFPGKSSTSRRRLDSVGKWPPSPLLNPSLKASTQPAKNDTFANHSDYLDLSDVPDIINPLNAADMHRHHLYDYERLRLRGIDSIFRISHANAHYDVVKTYPSAFVVPSSVGDDSFLKIAKGFKHGRFPACPSQLELRMLVVVTRPQTSDGIMPHLFGAAIFRGDKNIEFVPITFPTTHQMKVSFKKLLRVMRPSVPFMDSTSVSNLLSLASSIASVVTLHNSSVALCIEEGWDTTCQLMSLAQLLLDPYYRTIEGFQLLAQFHGAFEFNDFYLRFLAYHSQSAFFRTFVMDCESERVHLEHLVPETGEGHRGCIWMYIKEKTCRSTIFHNLLYSPEGERVLIPACSIAALQTWTFYSEETLSHGSPYDIDLAEAELVERDDEHFSHSEGVTTGGTSSRIVDGTIVCQDLKREDGITFLIQTNDRLNPLEKPRAGGWLNTWQTAEERMSTDDEDQDDKEEKAHDWDWQVRRVLLKRAALRVLLRGITSRSAASQKNVSKNHVFEHYGASGGQPSECGLCHFPLYGTVVRTGQRCRQCGVIAHDKCIVNLWPCDPRATSVRPTTHEASLPPTPVRTATVEGQGTVARSETLLSDLAEGNNGRTLTIGHGAATPSRAAAPLHQGYLSKKGAKFKLWAPRWFELEANSHKMYYYESEHDLECRGYIDLCDVGSVEVENNGNKAILESRFHCTLSSYAPRELSVTVTLLAADQLSRGLFIGEAPGFSNTPVSVQSPHVEFDNLEQVKYRLVRDMLPPGKNTDWIWDWSSRPEAYPPKFCNISQNLIS